MCVGADCAERAGKQSWALSHTTKVCEFNKVSNVQQWKATDLEYWRLLCVCVSFSQMELFYIWGHIAPCNYLSFHWAAPLLRSRCEVFCYNAHASFLKLIINLVTSIQEIYLEHQISLIPHPDYWKPSLLFLDEQLTGGSQLYPGYYSACKNTDY